MNHSDYLQLFQDLARKHGEIADGHAGRKSFFRINGEAELDAALTAQRVDFPALCLPAYFGRIEGATGAQKWDRKTAGFEIREHVPDALTNHAGVEAARDRCQRIAFELMAYLEMLEETEGSCGPFRSIEPNTVRYDFTGPKGTGEYGCLMLFDLVDDAWDTGAMDFDEIFPHA